jgi:hypothetical protein
VGRGGEAGAVADGDQQSGGGPDRDPRNRGQAPGRRVRIQQLPDLCFQGSSLFVDGRERAGQGRDHDVESAGARDHDGLLIEHIKHLVDHPGGHVRGLDPDHLNELASTGLSQAGQASGRGGAPGTV